MSNRKNKIKQFLVNCSLTILVFFLVLLVIELLLRRYHFWGAKVSWSEPDTIIGYRYTPEAEYWFQGENDHPIAGRINRHGWRDREWSLARPRDMIRIAVLGDSFVEAFQVEPESTFLQLAEAELNQAASARFELMNFARSGFTTTEELLILDREVAPFAPDIVVLFFFPENDVNDVYREFDPDPMRPFFVKSPGGALAPDFSFAQRKDFRIKKALNGLKQHSALFSLVIERINLLQHVMSLKTPVAANGSADHAAAAPVIQKIGNALSLATANPDSRYQQAFALNKMLLQKIDAACRQMNARFLLVCINLAAYHPDRERELRAIDPTFNPYFFDDDLDEFARQNEIDFIGLQRIFADEYRKTGKKLQWTHWNYDGHRLVARVLANHLAKIVTP